MTRKALPVGTELDRYVIKQMLAEDGRGISYLAVDTGSVSGSSKVLVREYFPRGISVRETGDVEPRDRQEAQEEFERGLAGFTAAGKTLMGLQTHTLVPALDIVEDNATAYLVLEWPEGRAFTEFATHDAPMRLEALKSQLAILLPGLEELHSAGLVHTALSPETLIRLDDGYPAISQLTHVERFDGDDINRTHLLLDTPYAAPELQSDSGAPIGPWTDIYGLAATCWFLLTGFAPAAAHERMASISAGRGDLLKPSALINLGEGYEQVASALLAGLDLVPERRTQSAGDLLSALDAKPALAGLPGIAAWKNSAHQGKIAAAAVAAVAAISVVAFGAASGSSSSSAPDQLAQAEADDSVLVLQYDAAPIEIDLPKAKIAEPRMVANAAWLLVDRDDETAVRSFLEKYDDEPVMSVIAAERLELLDERAWSAALSNGSVEALEVYLTEFSAEMSPPGLHVEEAENKIIDMTSAKEFRIAEARRLLAALGYKTNRRRGESKGLTKGVIGFQESQSLETDGEITDELLEAMSEEVTRRELEAKVAEELEARQVADAKFVELVQSAATSDTRTATGVTNRVVTSISDAPETEKVYITPPRAEPKVQYETKVASSKMARQEVEAALPKEPVRKVGAVFKDCANCPDLVVLPTGQFAMGSPAIERGRMEEEGPVRQVTISQPIAMGKYEVTVGQFEAFVRAARYPVTSRCAAETDAHDGNWQLKSGLTFRNPGFEQSRNHPVTCVSWEDAKAYAAWLSNTTGKSYRLASESEWEFAARAGTTEARHFGRSYRDGCKYANGADKAAGRARELWVTASCNDRFVTTAPAGSFRANAFGLHDMIGNVWEWTEDCFAPSYAGAPKNERPYVRAGCKSRVTRGGSWAASVEMLRSAARSGDAPTARYDMVGFRIVRELPRR